MNRITGILAAAALSAYAGVGYATAANVSGSYSFITISNCEASITTSKQTVLVPPAATSTGIKSVNPAIAGLMRAGIGIITFIPASAGATKGTAKITGSVSFGGGAMRIDNQGSNWQQGSLNKPLANYSYTATTFTFAGLTFFMNLGNLTSGVYKTVNLVRRENSTGNPNCVTAMTATKQ